MAGPDTRWLSETEQGVWRRLLAVERRLQDRLDQELRSSHGMSLGDYDVLVVLSEAPGRELRMSDLAARVALSRSGLTRRLHGMLSHGLVARLPCPEDGRGAMAQLTAAGAGALEAAAPTHVAGVRRYLIDAVGPRRLAGLGEGLGCVETALAIGEGDRHIQGRRRSLS